MFDVNDRSNIILFDSDASTSISFMTSRKSATKPVQMSDDQQHVLHQYQDTDGHFSLVRYCPCTPVLSDHVMIEDGKHPGISGWRIWSPS